MDHRLTSQVHGSPAEDGGFLLLVNGDGGLSVIDFEQSVDGGGLWSMKTNHGLSALAAVEGVRYEGEGFAGGGPRPVELEVTGASFDGRRTVTAAVRETATGAVLSIATWDNAPEGLFDGAVALGLVGLQHAGRLAQLLDLAGQPRISLGRKPQR